MNRKFENVFLAILIFNVLVGFINSILGVFNETELSNLPTQYAGWWVPIIGLFPIYFWRKNNLKIAHAIACVFYFLQIVAFYGVITINWWIGLNYSVLLGDPEVSNSVFTLNIISSVLVLAHLWQLTSRSTSTLVPRAS